MTELLTINRLGNDREQEDYVNITISSCGNRRKGECHAGAFADGAFDLGIATMESGYAFYNSESKTCAAAIMRTCCVDTVETVENAWEMLRRDAAAVICHRDL